MVKRLFGFIHGLASCFGRLSPVVTISHWMPIGSPVILPELDDRKSTDKLNQTDADMSDG